MRRLGPCLLLVALVSCAAPARPPVQDAAVVEPAASCRFGRDGGATVADRGIGGTGARVADRGIGGTGIVGVVTGFASICVDGMEAHLDRSVPVSINGHNVPAAQLRVGQVVAIDATGSVTAQGVAVQARTITVRYEVTGPVETVDTGARIVTVAGQRVQLLPTTWVAGRFMPGTWASVSGLRLPDGTIVASRLDPARAGTLTVRGRLTRDGDGVRIGGLALKGSVLTILQPGAFVTVSGKYQDGTAEVTGIDADALAQNPAGYFDAPDDLVIQAFARVERGKVSLANGQEFRIQSPVPDADIVYRNAIVWLKRAPGGTYIATALRYTSYQAQPRGAPPHPGSRGAGGLIAPPDPPPGPPDALEPSGAPDGADNATSEIPKSGPQTAPDDKDTAISEQTLSAPPGATPALLAFIAPN